MAHTPLPQAEYEFIYSKVPRLTVEVALTAPQGILLGQRTEGPCQGLWSLPGGTIRYGESVHEALHRVALDEIGVSIEIHQLLGWIEYPSHFEQGIDWPIGLAFHCGLAQGERRTPNPAHHYFQVLPEPMHDEQREFLLSRIPIS